MATLLTRSSTNHALFGFARALPKDQLPCKGDVLRNCWRYKSQGGKYADISFVVRKAAEDCKGIWEMAIGDRLTVAIISQKAIEEKLRRLYNRGIKINKNKNLCRIVAFKEEMEELFEICSCECSLASCQYVRCKVKKCDGFHIDCDCDIKVPKREVQFLFDQRTERKMKISSVDMKVTRMWKRVASRKNNNVNIARNELENEQNPISTMSSEISFNTAHDIAEDTANDSDFVPYFSGIEEVSRSQNRTNLPTLSSMCDRYMISNYAGAAIATATLIDYGIIDKNNKDQVIGPHKLRDARRKQRSKTQNSEKIEKISSLYFDGKKTATRIMIKNEKNKKWSSKTMVKDHYVILSEPGNKYLTHITLESGRGKQIAKNMFDYLVKIGITNQPIVAIGCDGTIVNVGPENGAIHHFERLLGRPLHYFICQLHANELPFRAIFYHYDGKPCGPEQWRGAIGKQIKESLSNLKIINFKPISFKDFPVLKDEVMNDLSWDQKYLYKICLGVITGVIDDNLAAIEPGPPSISRWITLWSRILRLYVATSSPSYELKRIVITIIRFSAPMWFFIKTHPYASHGSRNIFQSLIYLKNLNNQERIIIRKTIQRNAFFAHTDQLLLGMCADKDFNIRRKAVSIIQGIRNERQRTQESNKGSNDYETDGDIRRVVAPKLLWNAKDYHSMIDWKNELKTEPPFIATLSDYQINEILETPLVVPKWPNNTQAVERGIKVMSEACNEVAGYKARDGYIRQILKSRKLMPRFRTKNEFNF